MSDPLDLDALRATAEAATPGPWTWRMDQPPQHQLVHEPPPIESSLTGLPFRVHPLNILKCNENGDGWPPSEPDATHIATFDPPTIAALLDRLEAAEQRAEELTDVVQELARGDRPLTAAQLAAYNAAVLAPSPAADPPTPEPPTHDAHEVFEAAAQRELGMSGTEFAAKWDAGHWACVPEDMAVMRVAMLRPIATPPATEERKQ